MKSFTTPVSDELAVLKEAYSRIRLLLQTALQRNSTQEDKGTVFEEETQTKYADLVNLIQDITTHPSYRGPECWLPYTDIRDAFPDGFFEWEEMSPKLKAVSEALGKLLKDKGISEIVSNSTLKTEIARATEDGKALFTVSFPNERTVVVNDFVLARPHFNGANEKVFSYIFKNQNKRLTREELQMGAKLTEEERGRKPERILRDLGFEDPLLKLFFPHVSISAVHFRNPISRRVLKNETVTENQVLDALKARQ